MKPVSLHRRHQFPSFRGPAPGKTESSHNTRTLREQDPALTNISIRTVMARLIMQNERWVVGAAHGVGGHIRKNPFRFARRVFLPTVGTQDAGLLAVTASKYAGPLRHSVMLSDKDRRQKVHVDYCGVVLVNCQGQPKNKKRRTRDARRLMSRMVVFGASALAASDRVARRSRRLSRRTSQGSQGPRSVCG